MLKGRAGLEAGYFPITQTFVSLAICLDNQGIAGRVREGRASLNARDEISEGRGRSSHYGAEHLLGFRHAMEKQMTKVSLVSAALIAAALFTTQALAARNDLAARHASIKAHGAAIDCMRAPDVGAFASDPYHVPPCLPNTATGTFQ